MNNWRQRIGRLLLGLTGLLLVPFSPSHGQGESPGAWEFSAALNLYWYPDDDTSFVPVITADRDRLHLESRYNYEDARTASLFAGWVFPWEAVVSGEVTPLLGLVFGNTNGVAPGLELDASWWRLELYTELEYLFSFDDPLADFFYAWTETSIEANDWARVGVVTQRSVITESEREMDRGFFATAWLHPTEASLYVFNPDDDDPFFVFSLEIAF